MAAAPRWKIYTPDGEYVASTKRTTEAALVVGSLGRGAKVKYNHNIPVWHEGHEVVTAAQYPRQAARTMAQRLVTDAEGAST